MEVIEPRVASYEEQATAIREQLANILEGEEEWTKAAQTLGGIDLDSGKPLHDRCHFSTLSWWIERSPEDESTAC